jgi:hypothetical protein
MTRSQSVRRRGTFEDLGSALESLVESGDAAVVARGRPRWLVLRCPDGCGENIPINLDDRAGPAWRAYEDRGLTVYPSIWRETGCESHFVIWRNRIWWGLDWDEEPVSADVEQKILARLANENSALDPFAIATDIGEEPWVTSLACQRMYRRHLLAREGKHGRFGFRMKPPMR